MKDIPCRTTTGLLLLTYCAFILQKSIRTFSPYVATQLHHFEPVKYWELSRNPLKTLPMTARKMIMPEAKTGKFRKPIR